MSNFIFSRRTLQNTIYRLGSVLTADQLKEIVDHLNCIGTQRLPAMWEVIMLDVLAKTGNLRHEIKLQNGKHPDIELTLKTESGPFLILGDIVTVSDAGLDEDNPVEALSRELSKLATKVGLHPNHFHYEVSGKQIGPYGDAKIKLSLPKRPLISNLLKREVGPWLLALKADPNTSKHFDYNKEDAAFKLTYNTSQQYGLGSYLAYDVAASRDKNPLFKALKSKLSQLKEAPKDSVRLIIACEGDSAVMRASPWSRTVGTFNAHEIAEDFLRQNRSIDAVFLVAIESVSHSPYGKTKHIIKYDLVLAPLKNRSQRVTPEVIDSLGSLLQKMERLIPDPVQSAYNATLLSKEAGFGPSMIGGSEMAGNKIRLSSRAVHGLLAGEITIDHFNEVHGWNKNPGILNPFASMTNKGCMIADIKVESAGEKDDDWLTFRFGSPDPAIAKFFVTPPDNGKD